MVIWYSPHTSFPTEIQCQKEVSIHRGVGLFTLFLVDDTLITFQLPSHSSSYIPQISPIHYCSVQVLFLVIPIVSDYTICLTLVWSPKPSLFITIVFMAPRIHQSSHRGGVVGASTSRHKRLFSWHLVAYHFDFVPPEVRNDILHLERVYLYCS